jgi:hypothetical protein
MGGRIVQLTDGPLKFSRLMERRRSLVAEAVVFYVRVAFTLYPGVRDAYDFSDNHSLVATLMHPPSV